MLWWTSSLDHVTIVFNMISILLYHWHRTSSAECVALCYSPIPCPSIFQFSSSPIFQFSSPVVPFSRSPVVPLSSSVLRLSHFPVQFSGCPIFEFSSSRVLQFSSSPVLQFSSSPVP